MTAAEFKAARQTLGLTQVQIAPMLGLGAASRVSEIEAGKKVPKQAGLLMQAYIDGYRPTDWPRC
jgi:DNA-binding transcriptional regulator YiaG